MYKYIKNFSYLIFSENIILKLLFLTFSLNVLQIFRVKANNMRKVCSLMIYWKFNPLISFT